MRNRILLCLKTGWCVAALVILLTGTNMCVSNDGACAAASDTMLSFMFLLTFPTGIVFALISMLVFEAAGGNYPSDYILAWCIIASGGCLQWVIIVPRLFDRPKFTVIDLKPAQLSTPVMAPVPIATAPSPPATTQNSYVPPPPTDKTKRAPKRRNRPTPFDGHGRTPLERVITR
jgi:hypothetical protein